MVRKEKKTVISITHDMEELLLADEIVLMKSGQVLAHTNPATLLKDPELMKRSNLELPFICKLANSLKEKGIDVPSFANQEELISLLAKMKEKD